MLNAHAEERRLVGQDCEPLQQRSDQLTPGRPIGETLGSMASAPPTVQCRPNDVESLPGWLIKSGLSFSDPAP
jgi:hypothetical protein